MEIIKLPIYGKEKTPQCCKLTRELGKSRGLRRTFIDGTRHQATKAGGPLAWMHFEAELGQIYELASCDYAGARRVYRIFHLVEDGLWEFEYEAAMANFKAKPREENRAAAKALSAQIKKLAQELKRAGDPRPDRGIMDDLYGEALAVVSRIASEKLAALRKKDNPLAGKP